MSRVVKWLIVGTGVVASLCIAAVMCVMAAEVFLRYVLREPTYWALEVSTYLLVASVMLGGAYTLREQSHVGVEIVYELLPGPMKRFAYRIAMLSVLCVSLVLVWYGIAELRVALLFGDRSLTPLAMPMVYPMALVPIGGFLLAVQALELLVKPSAGGAADTAPPASSPLKDEAPR